MRGRWFDRSDHADTEPGAGWPLAIIVMVAFVVVMAYFGWL